MDALALRRNLDRHDLLEHLDPALHLRRLGRLVAEPVDERLHALELVVLLLLALAEQLHARLALLQVRGVVADVVGQRAHADLGDARHHRVEEEAVVRDQDDRVRVGREVFLEPVARFEIEMVGRLVEQQQAGASEQQLGERDAHLPAARERLAGAVEVRRREAEPAQHGRDLQIDAVAFEPPELLLQIAVARQHRRVLVVVGVVVSEAVLDRGNLGAHVEQRLEGQAGLLDAACVRSG